MDPVLRKLADEAEIVALLRAFGRALDTKDWDAYAETFTPDGEFEILGQRRVGREEIAAGPARDLARYARLQHVLSNQEVEVDGDVARVRCYVLAIHVPDADRPDEHADVGGCYTGECRRLDGIGWRFARLRIEVWWTGGSRFRLAPVPPDV
jgi:uncharacterized protein (TIGR02246 family)